MKKKEVKPKFFTMFNCKEMACEPEKNDLPSMTVPNQSTSVRELYNRFSNGEIILKGRPAYFGGGDIDNDFDITQRMDLDLSDISLIEEQLKFQSQSEPKKDDAGADDAGLDEKGGNVVDDPKGENQRDAQAS